MAFAIDKKWDNRFMRLAKRVSTWSKDKKHQVGAVIVNKQNRVVSTGYNGPPRSTVEQSDRDILRIRSLHAELNAILFSGRSDLKKCIMYVYPFIPCAQCAGAIIQVGISLICFNEYKFLTNWEESQKESLKMFDEARVFYLSLN